MFQTRSSYSWLEFTCLSSLLAQFHSLKPRSEFSVILTASRCSHLKHWNAVSTHRLVLILVKIPRYTVSEKEVFLWWPEDMLQQAASSSLPPSGIIVKAVTVNTDTIKTVFKVWTSPSGAWPTTKRVFFHIPPCSCNYCHYCPKCRPVMLTQHCE